MHYLAPLAIVLALSGAIYRTQEVWNKTEYDLFITLGWAKDVASDFAQLQKAVRGKKITAGHAQEMLQRKWAGPAGQGGPQLTSDQQRYLSTLAQMQTEQLKQAAAAQTQQRISSQQN